MPSPLGHLRRRTADFLTNLEAGPPWPAKAIPLLRNRAKATVKGCCGNPGQPGC
jgi:hypothetical protein